VLVSTKCLDRAELRRWSADRDLLGPRGLGISVHGQRRRWRRAWGRKRRGARKAAEWPRAGQ